MNSKGATAERTHILIADDHALFRYGMKAMLKVAAGYEMVGEAASGEEAVALTAELKPDIMLMDLQMPGMKTASATSFFLSYSEFHN